MRTFGASLGGARALRTKSEATLPAVCPRYFRDFLDGLEDILVQIQGGSHGYSITHHASDVKWRFRASLKCDRYNSRRMSLNPGDRLGPYEILSILGEGGMGRVYRARDTKLHREVAIKVLPDNLAIHNR